MIMVSILSGEDHITRFEFHDNKATSTVDIFYSQLASVLL